MMADHYDYIISGAGCAGLSLADRLCADSFRDASILIIDKDPKSSNDRTWSFWATQDDPHRYRSIYRKIWPRMAFHAPDDLMIYNDRGLYSYQTIQGLDFYNLIKQRIAHAPHITWLQAEVTGVIDQSQGALIHTDRGSYSCNYAFNSIIERMPDDDYLFVWQHFYGWEIQLDKDHFDDDTALLMDFRIEQPEGGLCFIYLLPFDRRTALVEITYFSKDLYEPEQYAARLRSYIDQQIGTSYRILETEYNKIPMTTAGFNDPGRHVIPIGTSNGTVKPSSGYAFSRIQREADALSLSISQGRPQRYVHSKKYLAYDRTLLRVLIDGSCSGYNVFHRMFARNDFDLNLRFLSEETSILEEMKLFSTLPIWPFTKAFFQENVF